MTSRSLLSNDAKPVDNKHTIRRVKIFKRIVGRGCKVVETESSSVNFGILYAFCWLRCI